MAQISILVRVHHPNPHHLNQMVESIRGQTDLDLELVLVVNNPIDATWATTALDGFALGRVVVRPVDELLAWSCNALLPTLGTWVGFLGQHDTLAPTTVAVLKGAISTNPLARIIYTDEETHADFGDVSLRFTKGLLNPVRLRTQEYLRDFTIFQTAHLITAGGFDRMASDWPSHDMHLRTLEARGPQAFLNIPQRLYYRRRPAYPEGAIVDPRREQYMVGWDRYAIEQHLKRQALPATVTTLAGTARINYQFQRQPGVTLILAVDDDTVSGERAIRQLSLAPVYRPLTTRVLYVGDSPANQDSYAGLCAVVRQPFRATTASLPEALNQEGLAADTEKLLFLRGLPINAYWLQRLVDHSLLPGVGAVGPRLISPNRITQPGTVGYRYEGWHWNSRGRFNVLSVPHQVSALSPCCLLLDTRTFVARGGFETSLPTLYGMDYCLQLDQAGLINILVPDSSVQVVEAPLPPAEYVQFQDRWPGWIDRFQFHLPID